MVEEILLNGKSDAGEGNVIRLPGRYKQFIASLNDAEDTDEAVIAIFVTSDALKKKKVEVARFELSGLEPADIAPILEALVPNVFAEVISITGGEVHVYGVADNAG